MRSGLRNTIRLAMVGLCVALVGCAKSPPQPAGGSTTSKAEKARRDAEALAVHGTGGAASAYAKAEPGVAVRHDAGFKSEWKVVIEPNAPGSTVKGAAPATPVVGPVMKGNPPPAPQPVAKGPPKPKTSPRPGSLLHKCVVSTIPYTTEADADEDAVALACEVVEQKLAALDPPVRYKPSPAEVKAEFIRRNSRTVRPPNAEEKEGFAPYLSRTDNLVYVEYDVEVTAEQVRELRAQGRVSSAFRVLGVLVVVALCGFLFLRADEWTKGYMTRWLALAAVTLAGGTAAALIFV